MFANKCRKAKLERRREKKGKASTKKNGGKDGEKMVGPVHDPVKCLAALRLGSRCWAHFSSEVDDGRELFRRENSESIRDKALTIKAGNTGAAHAIALKELWEVADQSEWNKRAREEIDIFRFVDSVQMLHG